MKRKEEIKTLLFSLNLKYLRWTSIIYPPIDFTSILVYMVYLSIKKRPIYFYRRQFASTFGCSWQALFYLSARLIAMPIAFLLIWMFYRDIKVSSRHCCIIQSKGMIKIQMFMFVPYRTTRRHLCPAVVCCWRA